MISDLITNSRLKTARGCAREHHMRYGLGYRSRHTDDALRFGDLIHVALEAWWRNRWDGENRLALALAALGKESDPFERARAEAMICGYDARWSEARLDPIAVEVEFAGDMVNPDTGKPSRTWRIAGKLDVLALDLDTGRVVIVEHKTSSEDVSLGSPYWRRLRMDSQVSLYFDGAALLGHPAEACIYDVLAKPGQKPLRATPLEARKYTKKTGELYANQRAHDETPDEYRERIINAIAEAPDAYYARGEVVRLESELADARYDVWSTARTIRDNDLASRHPRNPDACIRYGRTCSFFDVCSGTASLDDAERFERRANPHSELVMIHPKPRTKEESTNGKSESHAHP